MKRIAAVEKPSSPMAKFSQLFDELSSQLLERAEVIKGAFVGLLARENTFFLGPPGTAKTLLTTLLCKAFSAVYFEYLMDKFTKPEELFGSLDMAEWKRTNRYQRMTDGMLPQAHFVFIDEIWKGSSSINNTLLPIMNEHKFVNGGVAESPLFDEAMVAHQRGMTGDHGLEWKDGHLYVASPPSQFVHVIEVRTWKEVHRMKAPGFRVHGLAWAKEEGHVWIADTSFGVVSRHRLEDGRCYDAFRVADPVQVHGMTMKDDRLWYADDRGPIGFLSVSMVPDF